MSDLSEFLNIKALINDKREYKEMLERVEKLPEDYRFVFDKIQHYMFIFATGAGREVMAILIDVLETFEAGAEAGQQVLEITGRDVAAFCDKILKDAKIYTENNQEKLNREIKEKLG